MRTFNLVLSTEEIKSNNVTNHISISVLYLSRLAVLDFKVMESVIVMILINFLSEETEYVAMKSLTDTKPNNTVTWHHVPMVLIQERERKGQDSNKWNLPVNKETSSSGK